VVHRDPQLDLRNSRKGAGTAMSAGDMSDKLGTTANGDMTGSGNKPAKRLLLQLKKRN
jgi:hypothetical protein